MPILSSVTTLLVVAEGIINNRPLTPASDDPNDLEPLTPNHLLIHRPASAPPGLLMKMTCTPERNGAKYSIWQTYFGSDGPGSTF